MISRYHAQLISILAKLPMDVGDRRTVKSKTNKCFCPRQIRLPVTYAPAFDPSATPVSLNNLVFERAALLFNLAALFSQLAAAEDRSSVEGIKRAASNYQVRYPCPYPLWHARLCRLLASRWNTFISFVFCPSGIRCFMSH